MQRRLAGALPAGITGAPGASGAPLEHFSLGDLEPPRLIAAEVLEGRSLRSHVLAGPAEVRFRGFLDGAQTSRVLAHVDGVPIVHGTVAAVIRERRDSRLRTWAAPRLERRIYAPLAHLPPPHRIALADSGVAVVDTLEGRDAASLHPLALQDAAIHAVQHDREALERELAEEWCAAAEGPILVDGSISGSEVVAQSPDALGVVKSHRTLYAEGGALRTILQLGKGYRSSVFRVTSPKRTPVASWYLRMRDASGRDPLWGLVRVEVAAGVEGPALARRADEASRWVLAEALPLATPDARWDKMVYGIRDCEEFLRAIQ